MSNGKWQSADDLPFEDLVFDDLPFEELTPGDVAPEDRPRAVHASGNSTAATDPVSASAHASPLDHGETASMLAFPTILASTVHDIKNSLGMLMQSLDVIVEHLPEQTRRESRELAVLQYEAARVNSDLVQLLALYKLEQQQLPVNIGWYEVEEFLQDQVLRHDALLQLKGITVEFDVEDGLGWYFDYDLIASVINNVITNTIRYTRKRVLAHARVADGQLILGIADDGPGYPAAMIAAQEQYMLGINQSTGSTGLGLYFAGQVARLHARNGVSGRMLLANGQRLPGGEFRLYLP